MGLIQDVVQRSASGTAVLSLSALQSERWLIISTIYIPINIKKQFFHAD